MNLPRGWKIEKSVHHSPEPALFAWEFAKKRARSLGLKWKCRVRWGYTSYPGRWYGHACGKRGCGHVRLWINSQIPHQQMFDRRFKRLGQFEFMLQGTTETIVFLFAHEFGHIIGYGGDRAGEFACNNFGYDCVLAWRARECEHPACNI